MIRRPARLHYAAALHHMFKGSQLLEDQKLYEDLRNLEQTNGRAPVPG